MLKLKDIFKLAKSEFIPSLKSHGFVRYGRKYIFVRRHGDYFQVISFLGNRHGNRFYVTADVWVPSLCGFEKVSKAEFESTICAFNMGGNARGDMGTSKGTSYPETDCECESLLSVLLIDIEHYILPWFSYMADRKVLMQRYFDEPKSSLPEKREIANCDYQELKSIIADSQGIHDFANISMVASEEWPIPSSTENQYLALGLGRFVEYVSKFDFEYFTSPRFYLAKKYHDVYHFVEFDFVNGGLFLKVSISVYIDGEQSGYPAHNEDKSLCDIREDWPVFFYTPLNLRLKNEIGHTPFSCYNEVVMKQSIDVLIKRFDEVYQRDVSSIKTKADFKRLVKERKGGF